jgi:CheY-like chemotaxis protein
MQSEQLTSLLRQARHGVRHYEGGVCLHVGPWLTRALREIPELAVDAIFLDVELPGMGGFELLGRLPVKPAVVIVAKPEPQYALTAFRIQAVDFVSKPASREDLLKATVKVGMRLGRPPPGAFEDMKAMADAFGEHLRRPSV